MADGGVGLPFPGEKLQRPGRSSPPEVLRNFSRRVHLPATWAVDCYFSTELSRLPIRLTVQKAYGNLLIVVSPLGVLLAAGVSGAGALSAYLADSVAFSHPWDRRGWSSGAGQSHHLAAGAAPRQSQPGLGAAGLGGGDFSGLRCLPGREFIRPDQF